MDCLAGNWDSCREIEICGTWKEWKFEEKARVRDRGQLRRDESKEENEEVYCTCREGMDDTDWMIQCGQCEEWFHGKCIGLDENERDWSKEDFYCDFCVTEWGVLEE